MLIYHFHLVDMMLLIVGSFKMIKINDDLPFKKNPNHESKNTAWKYSSDVLELCMPIVGGERTRSFPILI